MADETLDNILDTINTGIDKARIVPEKP